MTHKKCETQKTPESLRLTLAQQQAVLQLPHGVGHLRRGVGKSPKHASNSWHLGTTLGTQTNNTNTSANYNLYAYLYIINHYIDNIL